MPAPRTLLQLHLTYTSKAEPNWGEEDTRIQGPINDDFLAVTAPIRGRGVPTIRGPLGHPEPSVVTDLCEQLQRTARRRTNLSFDTCTGPLLS